MKIQLDVKSALLGLVIGGGLILCTGSSGPGAVGKYQLEALAGEWVFLVDTQTGEVWGFDARTDNWDHSKKEKFWDSK